MKRPIESLPPRVCIRDPRTATPPEHAPLSPRSRLAIGIGANTAMPSVFAFYCSRFLTPTERLVIVNTASNLPT